MTDTNNSSANATPPPAGGGWAAAPFSRSACLEHYMWGDGCYGWTFVDTEALSVKQELMPPDTAEQMHYHKKALQVFFILKGTATFSIDGVESVLKPDQGIQIAPGQLHNISNNGRTDLEFILYSMPNTKGDRFPPTGPPTP